MAKKFSDLADRVKSEWSDDTRRAYEAASSEFAAEINERAALGAMLAAAREERSLSQTALSEATGVQQAEISRIEKGAANPTITTVTKLADALGKRLTLMPIRH